MNLTYTVKTQEQSAGPLPTASSAHDISYASFTDPPEDSTRKPVLPVSPQIVSKPSPDAILVGGRALKATQGDERGSVTGVRTGMGTTVEFRPQLKHKTPRGNQVGPLDRARPLHQDRALPPLWLPPQGSSSEWNVTSSPSHRQSDINAVAPPHQLSRYRTWTLPVICTSTMRTMTCSLP
jgi:hypothetical protein